MNATIAHCHGVEAQDRYQNCYAQGLAQANSGNYQAALERCDRALALSAHDAAGWVLRGVVLVHLMRYAEAIASCDKALEAAPNHQEAWLIRGAALNHLGSYKQSYRSYNQALGIEHHHWGQKFGQLCGRLFKVTPRQVSCK